MKLLLAIIVCLVILAISVLLYYQFIEPHEPEVIIADTPIPEGEMTTPIERPPKSV